MNDAHRTTFAVYPTARPLHTAAVRYTHLACLKAWARERGSGTCEICRCPYSDALREELRADIDAGLQAKQARRSSPAPAAAAAAALPSGAGLELGSGQPDGLPRWRRPHFWVKVTLMVTALVALAFVLIYLGMKASYEGQTPSSPPKSAPPLASHCCWPFSESAALAGRADRCKRWRVLPAGRRRDVGCDTAPRARLWPAPRHHHHGRGVVRLPATRSAAVSRGAVSLCSGGAPTHAAARVLHTFPRPQDCFVPGVGAIECIPRLAGGVHP